jgi:hypothetical protein
VIPHLTVGHHAPLPTLQAAADDVTEHLPVTATIRSVRLIQGQTDLVPWRTVAEFPLAAAPARCSTPPS